MMTGWLPEVGGMRAYRQAYRSCIRSEFGRRDLGWRESLGTLRGRRALRREGEVGTRDGAARGFEACGELRERASRALGEDWEAEIESRVWPRWGSSSGAGPRFGRGLRFG